MAEQAVSVAEKEMVYVPFGEKTEIRLSFPIVKNWIAARTKSGQQPTDSDVMRFMMLCKARELNPWVGDAYLVGYDSQDGATFSLITSIQALFKRAEANPFYNGIESGVIVLRDGAIVERQGDLVLAGETLLGGWAKVHRKDRLVPCYDSLNLSTYNTNRSQWKKDPAGMIVKCAEASALRKSFPSQLGSLFVDQEAGAIVGDAVALAGGAMPSVAPERRLATIASQVASGRDTRDTIREPVVQEATIPPGASTRAELTASKRPEAVGEPPEGLPEMDTLEAESTATPEPPAEHAATQTESPLELLAAAEKAALAVIAAKRTEQWIDAEVRRFMTAAVSIPNVDSADAEASYLRVKQAGEARKIALAAGQQKTLLP